MSQSEFFTDAFLVKLSERLTYILPLIGFHIDKLLNITFFKILNILSDQINGTINA